MNELKIISWNCNGIKNKTPELTAFIKENKTDIILLGETHLNPRDKLTIPNYYTYRTDRPKPANCPTTGGTAILIRRNIPHHYLVLPTEMDSTSIQIKLNNNTAQITSVYKSPRTKLHQKDLDTLTKHDGPFLIAGDLNSKHPTWNSRQTNTSGRKLLQHSESNNYIVIAPDSPTHFPYNGKHQPDVLDIALINLPSINYTLTNHNDLSSDHNPIQLNIQASPISRNPPKTSNKINWTKFKNELSQIKISNVRTPQEIDHKIDELTNNIKTQLENSTYTVEPKLNKSHLPAEITLEIETKRLLRKMWQTTRDPKTKKLYNAQITFVKKLLTDHRQSEWDAFVQTLNFKDKSLYKLNHCLLHKKPANTPLQTTHGRKIFEDDEKAELFADTMEDQFTNNPGENIQEAVDTYTEINRDKTPSQEFITPKQISNIINKLPNGKAPGHDNITNKALKNLPNNILTQLAHIFTACLRVAYFPKTWKRAIIIMIPKPGKNHSKPESHRPISLLPTMSKLFEKLVLKSLQKCIKPRPEQHAFREGHSTTTQLVQLFKDLKNNKSEKKYTAATFLDIEKAFDRVWHIGLIHKLNKNTDLPNYTVKLIKSFLTGRSFQIRVDDQLSTERTIQAGVPQGSCLSPILYTHYINDLPLHPQVKTSIFADDTMFHAAHRNKRYAISHLQKQINLTLDWTDKWRLKINAAKTESIIFGGKPTKTKITVRNQTTNWKNKVKYLGITIDSKLHMHQHVKIATQKAKGARTSLYPILNNKSPIPLKTKIQIYNMYIKPIILYGSVAWAPQISKSSLKKMEVVQNTTLRQITGMHYLTRNEAIQRSANLEPLSVIIKHATQTFYYKASISRYQHIQKLSA